MLADHVGTYVVRRKPWAAAEEPYRLGLENAQATEHIPARGLMHQRMALLAEPDWDRALQHAEQALNAHRTADQGQGIASTHERLGSIHHTRGDLAEGVRLFNEPEQLHLGLGRGRGASLQRRRLAEIRAQQGHLLDALAGFASAHQTLLGLDRPDVYQATRALQGGIDAVFQADTAPSALSLTQLPCHQGLHRARSEGALHQRDSLHTSLADLAGARAKT